MVTQKLSCSRLFMTEYSATRLFNALHVFGGLLNAGLCMLVPGVCK